jgi:putative tryptophan/tyrosine transport system substrate-binding protein
VKRRELAVLSAGMLGASRIPAFAQNKLARVGFLNSASRAEYDQPVKAFLKSLEAAGFVEGRTVSIAYRWAEGNYQLLDGMVGDLIESGVDVIAATSTPANVIAKRRTNTIPLVFSTSSDPIALGLVGSLNHPEANVTGVTTMNVELGPKRLDLVEQLLPGVAVIGHLVNLANPNIQESDQLDAVAKSRGKVVVRVRATTESELDIAFQQLAERRAGALIVNTDAFFFGRRRHLVDLANRFKIPAMYDRREFAIAGGLIAYGGSVVEAYRLVGEYVARILRGERPQDLPVQQATKVELALNVAAARGLGVVFPPLVLARADEVIE